MHSSLVTVVALLQLASSAWAQSEGEGLELCSLPGTPCVMSQEILAACSNSSDGSVPTVDPAAEQKCVCEKNIFDYYLGCANCVRLRGSEVSLDQAKISAQSSAYCSGTPTEGVAEYMYKNGKPSMVESGSDMLGTSTDVSLYFTPGQLKPTAKSGTTTTGTSTATTTATSASTPTPTAASGSSASAASSPRPSSGAAGGLATGHSTRLAMMALGVALVL
ncbi:MAG: hypothetical protein M1832_003782 [Thelocarpon impressellum]|nr:MAG: hypothetical protein M1832_003782 [Thelocarpon impressellum]